ncbi:MAG: alkyl hydroperoxide reductase [Betaproteobacteria bacterium SG8_40]|nr:MAG: alkyl hydroperoxide reductase [Betaproteobacteria bacterium SG8_40]
MTLRDELEQQLAKFRQRASGELIETIQAGVDELIDSGIARRAAGEGDMAPDFALPNALGKRVELSALLAAGPVVLTFYRGGWCPYCNLQLRAYQRVLPELRALGATLVAISPEPSDASLSTREKNALEFEVLSDIEAKAAKAYGVLFDLSDALREAYIGMGKDLSQINADGAWHLPIPATYVIAPNGRIALAYVDPEYRNRLEPADVLAAVRAMQAAEPQAG